MSEEKVWNLLILQCIEFIPLNYKTDQIKFLDTEIIRGNGKITTQLYNKMEKLPVHWTSKIPVWHKHSTI